MKTPTKVAPAAAAHEIRIPKIKFNILTLTLEGVTPLIEHRFSPEAIGEIEGGQQGLGRIKKAPRDPQREFEMALHRIDGPDGGYGFPAIGFKKSAVEACRHADGITMVFARTAFHVLGDMIPLESNEPRMRTDHVRIGRGQTTVRYRPEFTKWRVKLRIRYNSSSISPSEIVNLFNLAGFHVGVGERRPGKEGAEFGQFEVVGGDEAIEGAR